MWDGGRDEMKREMASDRSLNGMWDGMGDRTES